MCCCFGCICLVMTTERGFFGRLLTMRLGRTADIEMQAKPKMPNGNMRTKKQKLVLKKLSKNLKIGMFQSLAKTPLAGQNFEPNKLETVAEPLLVNYH